MSEKKIMGRPPIVYNPEIAEEICRRVATTDKSLRKICYEIEGCPSADIVYGWMDNNKNFHDMYVAAKLRQGEAFEDSIQTLSDSAAEMVRGDEEKCVTNPVFVKLKLEALKEAINARKWIAGRQKARLQANDLQAGLEALAGLNENFKEKMSSLPAIKNKQEY